MDVAHLIGFNLSFGVVIAASYQPQVQALVESRLLHHSTIAHIPAHTGLIRATAHRQNLHIDSVRQPVCAVFQDASQDCAVKVCPAHIGTRKIGAFKISTREIHTG